MDEKQEMCVWKMQKDNLTDINNPHAMIIQREQTMAYDCQFRMFDHTQSPMEPHGFSTHQFTGFSDVGKFLDWYISLPEPKHMFECIRGDCKHKPYFDIDIGFKNILSLYKFTDEDIESFKVMLETNLLNQDVITDFEKLLDEEADAVITLLIKAIDLEMEEKNIEYNKDQNLLIFSSHGRMKRSFHVIIDKFHFDNHHDTMNFSQHISTRMGDFGHYIDQKVYNSFRPFRLLGSAKKSDVKRIKQLDEKYCTYRPGMGVVNKLDSLLATSLITYVHDSYKLDSSLWAPIQKVKKSSDPQEFIDGAVYTTISNQYHRSILAKIYSFPTHTDSEYLRLKRFKPANCPACNRKHDHENACIYLYKGYPYFKCYRGGSPIALKDL